MGENEREKTDTEGSNDVLRENNMSCDANTRKKPGQDKGEGEIPKCPSLHAVWKANLIILPIIKFYSDFFLFPFVIVTS